MTVSRDQFVAFLEKRAQDATELESNDQVMGSQDSAVPTLLQPDDGPGKGPRGEEETFSSSAEKSHEENRGGGYLQDALPQFSESAKETGSQLKGLLKNFGPKAVTSKAQTDAGKDKVSSVSSAAFLDELDKIAVGDTRTGREALRLLKKRVLGRRATVKPGKQFSERVSKPYSRAEKAIRRGHWGEYFKTGKTPVDV